MANNAITKAERRFQRGIAKCVRAHRKRIGAAQDQTASFPASRQAHQSQPTCVAFVVLP